MDTLSWVTLIMSTAAIIATVCTFIATHRLTRDFQQATIFNECTRRFQEIMMSMPDEVMGRSMGLSPHIAKYMTLYFDLCSEEYWLHKKGYIPNEIWDNWVDGMRIAMHPKIYQTYWKGLSATYNEEFVNFIHHEVLNPTKQNS